MNKKNTGKIMSVIGYIVVMFITIFLASCVISFLARRAIEKAGEPKNFEKGYYEGYEQGLSKDYFNGWDDCRRYFKEYPEKLEL